MDRKVEIMKIVYPPGTRVEAILMGTASNRIAPGTKGTVESVDDAGTVHIRWDNGISLGACRGVDWIRAIGHTHPMVHKVKEHPRLFSQLANGQEGGRRVELRFKDRDYQVGDTLNILEWDPQKGFTKREASFTIKFVLDEKDNVGITPGYCVIGW